MTTVVVTQLEVRSDGAIRATAEFVAAMEKAKKAAVDAGTAIPTSFDAAQRKMQQVMASNDPVFAAQLKWKRELENQEKALARSVQLGQMSQVQMASELAKTNARHSESVQKIKEHTGQLTLNERAWVAMNGSMTGVQGQLIALSAGAGPVGTFLSALGPWGIAAAVGIGAVGAAINEVRDIADKAGKKAADLRGFAEATHLTIDEIRGLKKVAGEFQVGGDQIESWMTKASIAIERARLGSGELVDSLNRISPTFQRQMEQTTTLAESLDVLSAAARSAKEQGKDVALFWRDVFGRGSGRADAIFSALELAGGIRQIGAAMAGAAGTTSAEIEDRARLSRAIDVEKAKRESLIAAVTGSKTVLELELEALKAQTAALQKIVEMQTRAAVAQTESIRLYGAERTAIDEVRVAEEAREAAAARIGGRRGRANLAIVSGVTPHSANLQTEQDFRAPIVVPAAAPAIQEVANATENAARKAEQAYNAMSKWMTMLGAGATIHDTAALALKKLEMEYLNSTHGIEDATRATEIYNRAKAAIETNRDTQALQTRIGTLGEAPSVAEQQATKSPASNDNQKPEPDHDRDEHCLPAAA